MTIKTTDRRILETIPPAAEIRQRLGELRAEARILRGLLPIAEQRDRATARQSPQTEGADDE